jgi:hypothetical protein
MCRWPWILAWFALVLLGPGLAWLSLQHPTSLAGLNVMHAEYMRLAPQITERLQPAAQKLHTLHIEHLVPAYNACVAWADEHVLPQLHHWYSVDLPRIVAQVEHFLSLSFAWLLAAADSAMRRVVSEDQLAEAWKLLAPLRAILAGS